MAVSARMKCHEVVLVEGGRTVKLSAVYSNDKASPNYSYSQATPQGTVTLFITNPAAFEQFEVGKVYDMLFSGVAAG